MEDIDFFKNYDNNDLKHAIKSLTGVVVSDDFISILQKQIASNGEQEIDFDEFREAFSQITKSLYPNGILGNGNSDNNSGLAGCESKSQSNPPSPPPTPQRSRTNSYSSSTSQLSDLPSPPNSPRNSDSDNSFSPYSFSPLSSSPPKFIYSMSTSPNNNGSSGSPPKPTYYSTTTNIFSKPPPPSSSSSSTSRRPRSSSVRISQPLNIINKEPLNDDQHIMLMNHNNGSTSVLNSPSDKSKYRQQHYQQRPNNNLNNQNNLHTSQLFKSLLSMDEGYSDVKKTKSNFSSNNRHHHQKRSPEVSDNESTNNNNNNNNNQFHMDIDWSKHLNNKEKKKQFTYKIEESDNDNDDQFSPQSSSSSLSENEDIFSNFNDKKKKKKKKSKRHSSNHGNYYSDDSDSDKIEWATEEFYYDPGLDNLDDLHQVISILKEKYSIYSNKSIELEKKVSIALKTNNQLEDDLDSIKKDCITLSLTNQALKKNNQILESSIEYHSNNNSQIKLNCFNLEKENQLLKKRLQLFEEQLEKNQKLLLEKQHEFELKEIKYNSDLEILNSQYQFNITSIRNEYQKEFELEFKKNKELLLKSDLKFIECNLENQKLKTMLIDSNKNLESLEKLYDEKIKEYQSHQEESQSQTISQEILSTENQKLKKQIKKSEMQKILELKNEIKRTKKEHLNYKSLLLQGINDFKTIESSINNKFNK